MDNHLFFGHLSVPTTNSKLTLQPSFRGVRADSMRDIEYGFKGRKLAGGPHEEWADDCSALLRDPILTGPSQSEDCSTYAHDMIVSRESWASHKSTGSRSEVPPKSGLSYSFQVR